MTIYEGTVTIPLQRPLKYEDKTFTEVTLDFSKVTGKTIINAEKKVFEGGNMAILRNMSADYCSHIAAVISGIPYNALMKLHSADFDPVWQTVAAFVSNRDPQEFYSQYTDDESESEPEKDADEDEVFPGPAITPEPMGVQ